MYVTLWPHTAWPKGQSKLVDGQACVILPSPLLSEQRYYAARRHAVTLCVCVRRAAYITYRLHTALVSAAKVMRCIQCSVV